MIVGGAQLVAGAQIVRLGGILQREAGNDQRHVVLIVHDVLWLERGVASVPVALLDHSAIDGPFDSWRRAGTDGDVHDGSVIQIQAIDGGFGLMNGRICGQESKVVALGARLIRQQPVYLHRTLMM